MRIFRFISILGMIFFYVVNIGHVDEKYLARISFDGKDKAEVLSTKAYGDLRYYTTYYSVYSVKGENIDLLPKSSIILEEESDIEKYFLVAVKNETEFKRIKNIVGILFFDGKTGIIRCEEDRAFRLLAGFKIKLLPEKIVFPEKTGFKTYSYTLSQIDEDETIIQSLVNQISSSQVKGYITDLQNFGTRFTFSTGCVQAKDYLVSKFSSFGLEVTTTSFLIQNQSKYNVIAELEGITSSGKIFVLSAHYDSLSSSQPEISAPGADDNASGCAVLLSIAEILYLTGQKFNSTIRLAAFCAEEQGLYGSKAYVEELDNPNIIAVMNLDMVAYWTEGAPYDLDLVINVYSKWLADYISQVNDKYVNMPIKITIDDSAWWSDHSSFWDKGFTAIYLSEAYNWYDPGYNPYVHSAQDTVDKLDLNFATEIAKVTIASTFQLADPVSAGDEIVILEPDGTNDTVLQGADYVIRWTGGTSTTTVSLYYSKTMDYTAGSFIVTLFADQEQYVWDTGIIPSGEYYICFVTDNSTVKYSVSLVTVLPWVTTKVIVYPNPFRPTEGHTQIYFKYPIEQTTIKIYTISGELITTIEETDGDGEAVWYAKNSKGNNVASGVYIYLVTNPQVEKKIGKIAIIR